MNYCLELFKGRKPFWSLQPVERSPVSPPLRITLVWEGVVLCFDATRDSGARRYGVAALVIQSCGARDSGHCSPSAHASAVSTR